MDTIASSVSQEIASKVVDSLNTIDTSIGWSHIALAVLGALLYNLMEFDKLRTSNKKFVLKTFIAQNWPPMLISAVSLVTMFLLKEDLQQVMGFDMTNRRGCFLAGFTVHTFTSKANSIAGFTNGEKKNGSASSNGTPPPSDNNPIV